MPETRHCLRNDLPFSCFAYFVLFPFLPFFWNVCVFFAFFPVHCIQIIYSIAAACYTIHYAKRLYETLFIHRFSHATMPMMNLFKNCAYYWGFTAYVAYHVCHPLFTPPSQLQQYIGLAGFAVCISYCILKCLWAMDWFESIRYVILSYANWVIYQRTLLCAIYGRLEHVCERSQYPIGIHSRSYSSEYSLACTSNSIHISPNGQ